MNKTKNLFRPLMAAVVMLLAMLVPQGAWALSGNGSSSNPYQITSGMEFYEFYEKTKSQSDACAILLDDITMRDYVLRIGGQSPYKGTFDGNGKTIHIEGCTFNSNWDWGGLFMRIEDATIKDLTVTGNLNFQCGDAGSVVGYAKGNSQILNVTSSVNMTYEETYAVKHIGGIVGNIEGSTVVKGCTYTGTMNVGSSTDSNGGIVGFANASCSGSITNCFFNGTIKTTGSDPQMGGILGYTNDESKNFGGVQNCYSCGTLTFAGSDTHVNAIVGRIRARATTTINNTYLSGTATRACNTDGPSIPTSNTAITISVTAGNNGTVSQSYVNPTSTTATKLHVEATPNTGYHFTKWSDNGAQTHNVGLTDNVSLSASFAIDQHTISVKTNDSNMGTVSGGGTFDYNSTKTITATPKSHHHFVKWDDGDTNASRTITVTEDKTYIATFAIDQHTITVTTNNSNYGTVSGGGTFDYGSAETITATPKTGYHFVKWSDGNTSASRTITVNGNATYTATFAAHTYGDWITDVAATCTTSGTKHRQCTHTGCDDRIDGTIPALGHDYAQEFSIDTEATCSSDGSKSRHCSRCEGTIEGTVIPATGHSFADDDLAQGVCTTCHHGFFRYTSKDNVVVNPYNYAALTDADGNQLTHISNTNVDGKGVIEFNKPLANIGAYAFYRKTVLTGMTIPNSVTGIGNVAFGQCTGFTGDLVIPESVTSIGASAFNDCGFTGDLVIPESVTSIGNNVFTGCGFTGNLVIPESVTSIGNSAFSGCSFSGNLVIPESVTSIGNYAFKECSGFTGDLVIPTSITSIDDNTFYGCTGFNGKLVIPESVTSIGNSAFQGCTGFKSVVLKSKPAIGVDVFDGVTSNRTFILNDNSYLYTNGDRNYKAVQSASYTRALEAGKTVTFILPFDIPVDNINGKVYVLTGFDGETLTFSEPVGGIARANKPYLLTETVEGNLMKAPVSAVSVRDPQTIKIGNASMVGTYTKQTGLFSTAEESIYGYSGGQFVRQKSKEEGATQGATLNRFRALIKVKGEVGQTLKIQFVDKAGNLTASDVVAIQDIILSDSQSEEELNKYDLNNDDEISVIDLAKLVKYLNAEHANLQTEGAATEGLEFE